MMRSNLVVMGVSGSGKSSVGRPLAAALDATFLEGDDFHPPANIAKMSSGHPLDDDDRAGWLAAMAERLREARARSETVVLSCSALKRRYRDALRAADPQLVFVYLEGDRELIDSRLRARHGHFMPESLLASQFRDLEPPQADERAIRCDIRQTPERISQHVLAELAAAGY